MKVWDALFGRQIEQLGPVLGSFILDVHTMSTPGPLALHTCQLTGEEHWQARECHVKPLELVD